MATDIAGVERSNISGIVLHVTEGPSGQALNSLTFHKSQSYTIIIGRKSSQGNVEQYDPERALFRCPVVSRKHAKITFTEYGNVYITDLHSHHGTHILRPGELVSTSLKPEVPTVLADGDLITFGKSVGREVYFVRPVVIRVELIFGEDAPVRASSPSPKSLESDAAPGPEAADDSRPQSQLQSHGPEHDKASTRSSTGRYGVFLPSPQYSSSGSDSDSDVQEISPPSSPRDTPFTPSMLQFPESSGSLFPFGRLRLLQQMLPPIHPLDFPEPEYTPESFALDFGIEGDVREDSDMELSSNRSPSPHSDRPTGAEPSIVGAWPRSPSRASSSPSPIVMQREVIVISDDDSGMSLSPSVEAGRHEEPQSPPHAEEGLDIETVEIVRGQAESIVEVQTPAPLPDDDHVEVIEVGNASVTSDTGAIEAQIAETRNELTAIRAMRKQDESLFSTHVEQMKSRLDMLNTSMQDTRSSMLSCNDEVSAIHTRMENLKTIVSGLQQQNALAERLEDLMKEVGAAKDMLQETYTLQQQTRAQMEEELEALKALRAEGATIIGEAKIATAAAQAVAQSVTSLKRKRDEVDGEGSEPSSNDHVRELQASPPKRMRTLAVVSKIAQTATVATLGAAAAWTALAFS